MPILHTCSYPGCTLLTFGPYCIDHEAVAPTPSTAARVTVAANDDEPVDDQ